KPVTVSEYVPPDYEQDSLVEYEVFFRNRIGLKVLRLMVLDFDSYKIRILDLEEKDILVTLHVKNIERAIRSRNVITQITMATKGIKREAYKVWLPEAPEGEADPLHSDPRERVKGLISNINGMIDAWAERERVRLGKK
ncbi:hypothetical protein KIPB_006141, partial [Kipferlia bialata]